MTTDTWRFVGMERCGTTFARAVLIDVGGVEVPAVAHTPAAKAPPGMRLFGAVRDPWSWTISFAAYIAAKRATYQPGGCALDAFERYADGDAGRLFRAMADPAGCGIVAEGPEDRLLDACLRAGVGIYMFTYLRAFFPLTEVGEVDGRWASLPAAEHDRHCLLDAVMCAPRIVDGLVEFGDRTSAYASGHLFDATVAHERNSSDWGLRANWMAGDVARITGDAARLAVERWGFRGVGHAPFVLAFLEHGDHG